MRLRDAAPALALTGAVLLGGCSGGSESNASSGEATVTTTTAGGAPTNPEVTPSPDTMSVSETCQILGDLTISLELVATGNTQPVEELLDAQIGLLEQSFVAEHSDVLDGETDEELDMLADMYGVRSTTDLVIEAVEDNSPTDMVEGLATQAIETIELMASDPDICPVQ